MTTEAEKIVVSVEAKFQKQVGTFLEKRRRDVSEVLGSIGKGDYDSIKMLGGGMKKMSEGFGMEALSQLGQALETAAALKDSGRIKTVVAELTDYLNRLSVEFV
ncbi:MAG: hypothetical protein SFH39_03080 [Candidatus Magnetobacterium sp. LHC-1]|uniref:HPt domain-containing protein n=1 Tax=Candidatus Magnetobacterium casense TaxID=1455061 RepID=A0ABS6RUW0_9BACT|nr:hypothetical protein [Candidatus Magnetobacterium casensis]MBF0608142.1 hypothetical protein [Nitrospirota bacterium]MBV6340408.1 hypothetical protein [Candidatus Magnetobacterium casensis]